MLRRIALALRFMLFMCSCCTGSRKLPHCWIGNGPINVGKAAALSSPARCVSLPLSRPLSLGCCASGTQPACSQCGGSIIGKCSVQNRMLSLDFVVAVGFGGWGLQRQDSEERTLPSRGARVQRRGGYV